MKNTEFGNFLAKVSSSSFETNTTATGSITIQQSTRNALRREGVKALLADLTALYPDFDVVETASGIILVAENEPGDFTFSWELKSTIKSLDYDPFIEAERHYDATTAKQAKREAREAEKAERAANIAAKRAKKLAEVEEARHRRSER